jgi:hypothetical protein
LGFQVGQKYDVNACSLSGIAISAMLKVCFIALIGFSGTAAQAQVSLASESVTPGDIVWVKPTSKDLSRTFFIRAGFWSSEIRFLGHKTLHIKNATCVEELKSTGSWKIKDSLLSLFAPGTRIYKVAHYKGFVFLVPVNLISLFEVALRDGEIRKQFNENREAIGFNKRSDLRFVYSARR